MRIQTKKVNPNTHSIILDGRPIGELSKLSSRWWARSNFLSEFQGITVERHLKKETVDEYVKEYIKRKNTSSK